MSTQRFNILDGPTANICWMAAQHAYSDKITVTTSFTIASDRFFPKDQGSVVELRLTGVAHNDGSGQSLTVKGYLYGEYFKGHYNARTRKGLAK